MPRIQLFLFSLLTTLLLGTLASCGKANIDTNEAVRSAILRHLEARGDLGMENLDIQIVSAKFNGDSSEAEVRLQPKGQPPESGMTMRYTLLRDGDTWKVQPKSASGHAMPPTPGTMPATPGTMPPTGTVSPAGALPPGHPPVNSAPRQ